MLHASAKQYLKGAIGHWLIAALVIASSLSGASAQTLPSSKPSVLNGPRFLPVDEAFPFYTSLPSPGMLAVHWEIAPGYYLYKEKFSFTLLENGEPIEFSLSLPEASAHHDEFFGDVQVYFENLAAQLTLQAAKLEGEIVLLIEYQGCAEAGFCYTLQRREIPLVL